MVDGRSVGRLVGATSTCGPIHHLHSIIIIIIDIIQLDCPIQFVIQLFIILLFSICLRDDDDDNMLIWCVYVHKVRERGDHNLRYSGCCY